MASTRPVMWPPDRGFRREPPVSSTVENVSTFEKIIRYAEKDDVLLYMTALFGVFMPAVMYFVYKAAHSKRERARQRAVTLFYMPINNKFKRIAYDLAEHLELMDPMVASLIPANLTTFRGYKGVMMFLIPDVDPENLTEELGGWFLDWLQEMRFEARQTDLLSNLKFATLAINLEKEDESKGKALSDVDQQVVDEAVRLQESIKEAWEDYDSDDTNLLSTEEEFSDFDLEEEELLENEIDSEDLKKNN